MNTRTSVLLIALVAMSGLAACTTPGESTMSRSQQMPMKDMAQMCGMHQSMMAGKSPEEQQALMESHMKAMHGTVDSQMVAQHRQMMDKNCASVAPAAK